MPGKREALMEAWDAPKLDRFQIIREENKITSILIKKCGDYLGS